eukprot:GHVR01005462.1.p2 GENE.GHVR01005462.1~~GHVR01005462.1.p2  ORF type:complete len:108 (+),score=1.16 GHVR01005462.1:1643-1966(+)
MTIINNNECLVCSASCKTCSNSTYCTSCYTSNYLYNGTCTISCPLGSYKNATSFSCLACKAPCERCQSSTYCDTCINPKLFLTNGLCNASCTAPLIGVNSLCVSCNT